MFQAKFRVYSFHRADNAYAPLIRKHHVEKDCHKEGGIFGGRALAAWAALRGIPAVS